ncbi:transporter substrate-binding domain-containing protein [Aeromonas dhakensis]|uniref:transporter substrate-binding domain-containing protein n=1 Tax=Aeromonas dhakensis TaxID=196024 RepID=UPI0018A6D895|nr:transporter substrate-binding domain-containing protein [Aeromonas dhakensis]MBF8452177.1 transporter substrate-binding domain-containing protein [Aeromonas dhakensis]
MIRSWLWCFILLAGSMQAAETPIRAWNLLLDHPNPAVAGLLRLSLDLTVPEYGPYRLIASPPMEQGRAVKELQGGELVQVGVFAPDEERERTLLAIHVPLAKGLLGWRVCLVRQGDEGRFANIRSLTDWRQAGFRIGQHRSWPDTRLLKENGLDVVVGGLYEALFNMLHKRRFDCFLRSVIEIEDELTQHPDLAIEPHLVFRYPLALLFFVSPRYPELAKRIELGLQRARQSGDYERIFEAGFGSTIRRLQLERRVMLELSNPDLPTGSRAMMQDPSLIYAPVLPALSAQ